MDIGAGLLGKTHHVKLMQGGDLLADDLRVVDPHRTAKLGGQAQQVVGVQIGISLVKRAWHGHLRINSFFMITPQRKENKKYRFIASLCKNDMDSYLISGALCPPSIYATSRFFTP